MSQVTGNTTKLFDNKQIIHMVSEAVVLFGISFYFSSQNKKLMSHIEELAHRIEEQDDKIQQMGTVIEQMNKNMSMLPIKEIIGKIDQQDVALAGLENSVYLMNQASRPIKKKSEKRDQRDQRDQRDKRDQRDQKFQPASQDEREVFRKNLATPPPTRPSPHMNGKLSGDAILLRSVSLQNAGKMMSPEDFLKIPNPADILKILKPPNDGTQKDKGNDAKQFSSENNRKKEDEELDDEIREELNELEASSEENISDVEHEDIEELNED